MTLSLVEDLMIADEIDYHTIIVGVYFPIVKLFGIVETFEEFVLELELMQSTDLFEQLSLGKITSQMVFDDNSHR